MMAIAENDKEISDLDVEIADDEGDLSVMDMMASERLIAIKTNSDKIAANMMSIAANTAAIPGISDIVSEEIASNVATINANIAANSAKIAANMMSVAANAAKVSDNVIGVQMVSSAILSESMVSEPDAAFIGSLAALVSAQSNAIAN